MTDTIKEYLVGLGFAINQSQYNKVISQLKNFDATATKSTNNVAQSMIKGSSALVGFIVSVNKGVADLIIGLGNADMETQRFARRMWMSYDAAKSLQSVMSAMGEDMSTLGDVAMNPEQRARFFALRKQAEAMAPKNDYLDQMKKIRDVNFEFTRLKLEATYGLQWIGYYLSKYLGKPIDDVKKTLKDMNDNIQKNMPKYAAKIAEIILPFIKMGGTLFQLIKDISSATFKFFNDLPVKAKVAAGAVATIGFAMLNPFTATIVAVGALLLLLDDYYTYVRGGKSLYADTWKGLDPDKNGLKGFFDQFEGLNKLLGSIGDLMQRVADLFGVLNDKFKDVTGMTIFEAYLKGLNAEFKIMDGIISSISSGISTLSNLLKGDLKGAADSMPKNIPDILKKLFMFQMGGVGPLIIPFLFEKIFPHNDGSNGDSPTANVFGNMYGAVPQSSKNSKISVAPTYNIYGSSAEGVMTIADRHTLSTIHNLKSWV